MHKAQAGPRGTFPGRRAGRCIARRIGLHPQGGPRGVTGRRKTYGGTCRHHAAIDRGRRAFRPPDPPLEPAHEAVYLRRAQRRSHPRPVADRAAVRARARFRLRHRGRRAARCCSSAPSARRRKPIAEPCAQVRPAFRQPPLAGRHAHQLEDHLWFDQAPEDPGRAAFGRHARPHQEGSAPDDARARQAGAFARRHPRHGRHSRT
jgi:hypothetical protein